MKGIKAALEQFKSLQITKADLQDQLGGDLYAAKSDKPMIVNASDVIFALRSFERKTLTLHRLLDWVNVLWFTDLYEYNHEQEEAIACVMDELEELDEEGRLLTSDRIECLVQALEKNEGGH